MVKPSSLKDKTPMCLVNELARYNRVSDDSVYKAFFFTTWNESLFFCGQIQHQYKLTKEEGPPHKKKFTVTLKLGNAEFEAQGTSIKKAQHEAAAIALRNTKYEHPPPKLLPNTRGTLVRRASCTNERFFFFWVYLTRCTFAPSPLPKTVNTTPTVELNALAMKRGELTTYTMLSQPTIAYYQPPYSFYPSRSVYQVRPITFLLKKKKRAEGIKFC